MSWRRWKPALPGHLVALHDERVEEEKRGVIHWLRPEYQIPRLAPDHAPAEELDLGEEDTPDPESGEAEKDPRPASAVGQLEAVTALALCGLTTVEGLVAAFEGPDRRLVARHLETLEMLGEVGGGGSGE